MSPFVAGLQRRHSAGADVGDAGPVAEEGKQRRGGGGDAGQHPELSRLDGRQQRRLRWRRVHGQRRQHERPRGQRGRRQPFHRGSSRSPRRPTGYARYAKIPRIDLKLSAVNHGANEKKMKKVSLEIESSDNFQIYLCLRLGQQGLVGLIRRVAGELRWLVCTGAFSGCVMNIALINWSPNPGSNVCIYDTMNTSPGRKEVMHARMSLL